MTGLLKGLMTVGFALVAFFFATSQNAYAQNAEATQEAKPSTPASSEKPLEKATEKPAGKTAEKPDEKPADKPGDKPAADAKKLAEDRTSRATARAKGELNFDDLKFDIEKGGKFERTMLPKEIEELNKKTIRIRGFILPQSVLKMTGFEEFVLVRDNMECCFGPGAALYDCIMIRMEKGKSADFTTRPVAVKGKFEIKEFKDPTTEQHFAIYFLTATEVK
jgi:hypothetical protein